MPTTPTLVTFAVAAFALVVIPGPNLIYIVTRGIQQGRRAAVVSSMGVQTGMMVHIILATLGLSALIARVPLVLDVLRYAGGGYLMWLGISLLRKRHAPLDAPVTLRPASMLSLFLHGLVINLLNPKVVLFVLALLPQFVDPRVGSTATQMLVLGSVLIVVALTIDSCYAFASGTVGAWLRHHPRASHHGDRISGMVYLVLGIAVAVTGSGSGRKV